MEVDIVYFTMVLIGLPILIVSDFLWLGLFARKFYHSRLEHLLGDFNIASAIILYAVLAMGIIYYAVFPFINAGLHLVSINGALFGFFVYAIYDLTSHTAIRHWPLSVTIVDILWGTIMCAFVATSVAVIYSSFILEEPPIASYDPVSLEM